MSAILAKIPVGLLANDGDWVGFRFEEALRGKGDGIAMRVEGEVRAFRNRCPHWGTPLDQAGEPVDTSRGEVVCPMHGARFVAESGECVSGPCVGDHLEVFTAEEGEKEVVIRRRGLDLSR